MSKWTPGPWRIAEADEAYDDDIIEITSDARAGMVPICRIGVGFRDEFDAEQKANARLIAASWTMAQALIKIACFDDELANKRLENTGSYSTFDEPGSVQIARAALARAEGRS